MIFTYDYVGCLMLFILILFSFFLFVRYENSYTTKFTQLKHRCFCVGLLSQFWTGAKTWWPNNTHWSRLEGKFELRFWRGFRFYFVHSLFRLFRLFQLFSLCLSWIFWILSFLCLSFSRYELNQVISFFNIYFFYHFHFVQYLCVVYVCVLI